VSVCVYMCVYVYDPPPVLQSAALSSSGFVEGPSRPFVYNLLLLPGELKAFSVRFTPSSNHSVSSLLIVRSVLGMRLAHTHQHHCVLRPLVPLLRNNLTVMDTIVLHGRGTTESLKVAGKPPGHGSSLRFKMTEALLKDCTDRGSGPGLGVWVGGLYFNPFLSSQA